MCFEYSCAIVSQLVALCIVRRQVYNHHTASKLITVSRMLCHVVSPLVHLFMWIPRENITGVRDIENSRTNFGGR